MQPELKDIIAISKALGSDTQLTQGGGGNTSVKTDDLQLMYLKASGTALKNMSAKKGWRRLQLPPILDMLKDNAMAKMDMVKRENKVAKQLLKICDDTTSDAQPSIEAHMHGLLRKYTVHLHPTAVSPYVCSRDGEQAIEKLFAPEKLPPLWVPCADTGYMTARRIAKLLPAYRKQYQALPKLLFLQKHGLVVTEDSAAAVIKLTQKVVRTCQRNLQKPKAKPVKTPAPTDIAQARKAIRAALKVTETEIPTLKHYFDAELAKLLAQPEIAQWCKIPALVPHELSYANGMPLFVDDVDTDKIAKQILQARKKGIQAPTFLVKNIGLFVIAPTKKNQIIKDVLTAGLTIRQHLDQLGGANPMTKRQQLFTNTVYAYSHS